ncbi:hydroxyacylglutathione hydrolase [Sphingomonas sp. RS2018]
MALQIACVPVLSDNYVWLIHDDASGETVAIDPGEADPVLAAAGDRGWTISQVWNTHWHPDHTGGNAGVVAATQAPLTGPAAEEAKIANLDVTVAEGDQVRIGDHVATVLETPGHTAGHIVFHFADDDLLFSGDTLFSMGCGRLFEGTADQMFANMERFAAMPDATVVYGAHEYTQSNGRFALTVDPDNAALAARMAEVDRLRAEGKPTLPTTIAVERATNPFLRARDAAEFAELRAGKDAFRG